MHMCSFVSIAKRPCTYLVEWLIESVDWISVLLATQSVIKYDPSKTGPRTLIEVVEDAGFEAGLWRANTAGDASSLHRAEAGRWRRKLVVSGVLTTPVASASMVMMLPGMEWWVPVLGDILTCS